MSVSLDRDSSNVLKILVTHAHEPQEGDRNYRGYRLLRAEELAKLSLLSTNRLRAAVDRLAALGFVGADYSSGAASHGFRDVVLTPEGIAAWRERGLMRSLWREYGKPSVIALIGTVVVGLATLMWSLLF